MIDSIKYKNVAEQLLPVVAYGDAAGLPYEGQKPMTPGQVVGLNPIVLNRFVGERPAGTWSDDTQLTLASMKALIDQRAFTRQSQVDAHVTAYRHTLGVRDEPDFVPPILTEGGINSWGGSTVNSIKRIVEGIPFDDAGEKNGAGNGVLMKMAPLVLYQTSLRRRLWVNAAEIEDFTRMTHRSGEAFSSSLVHSLALRRLLDSPDDFIGDIGNRRHFYMCAIKDAELCDMEYDPQEKTTSTALKRLAPYMGRKELSHDAIIENTPKRGFRASETLMMAYGSFAIDASFPEGVYRTVEMGGDADSTGSIVATMSLFANGSVQLPPDATKLYDQERLRKISKEFSDIFNA